MFRSIDSLFQPSCDGYYYIYVWMLISVSHVSMAKHTCCNGYRNNLKTKMVHLIILTGKVAGKCKSWRVIRLPLYQSLPLTRIASNNQHLIHPQGASDTLPLVLNQCVECLCVPRSPSINCFHLIDEVMSNFLMSSKVSTVRTQVDILDWIV